MTRALSAVALAASCGFGAREAAAQSPRFSGETLAFRYIFTSSTECRDAREFAHELLRRTSRLRPAIGVEPGFTFFVDLIATQGGVEGQLGVRHPDGSLTQRAVPGVDCHEVLSAMGLIAALMTDQFAGVAAPPSEAEPALRSPWRFGAGTFVSALSAVAPGLTPGMSVHADALYASGPLHPSLRLGAFFAQRTAEAQSPARSLGFAEFEWYAARLSLCPLAWLPAHAVSLKPCAFSDLGALSVRGFLTTPNNSATAIWWDTGLGGIADISIVGPLTLGFEAGVFLPLVRGSFYFLPANSAGSTIHTIPAVGLTLGAGLGIKI